MTIVGKILVFLNLVFSLIVGGLVMVVYMTRTNWEDGYNQMKARYSAVEADRNQTVRDSENARKDSEDKLDKMTKDRDAAITSRDAVRTQLTRKEEELATIKQKGRADDASVTSTLAATEARAQQVRELETAVDTLRKEKRDIIAEKNEERKARIQADVESKSFKSRNLELESQVRDMAREILRVQAGPAGAIVSRRKGEENPPLDNVQGKVVTVDPEDQLVKLSIGSDAGLVQGHTLKVFRLHPIAENSRYLGVIEILSVRPHEAVGRPLKPMAVSMRPGDHVAARLGN